MHASITDRDRLCTSDVDSSLEKLYWSVVQGVGIRHSSAEYLIITGNESIDFLNRLSTNDLSSLAVGDHRTTVLTTEKGRIVDLVTVLCRKNDLLLIVSAGAASRVESWLSRFVIMEDISIRNVSHECSGIELYGPKSKLLLEERLEIELDGAKELSTAVIARNGTLSVLCDPLWNGARYLVTGESETIASLFDQEHGVSKQEGSQFPPVEVFDGIRIERCIPIAGHELTEEINPLEAGLLSFVSFTKGCYIGQEVIARMDTYKKLQKKLTCFLIDGIQDVRLPFSSKIRNSALDVGFITSCAWSFRHNQTVALGYLKTSVDVADVEIVTTGGGSFQARVTKIPVIGLGVE